MNYLLDTNVLIDFFHGEEKTVKKMERISFGNLAISAVTIAEMYHGAYKTLTSQRYIDEFEQFLRDFSVKIFPFDSDVAKVAGELQGNFAKKKVKLTGFDAVIAATGLFHSYTVLTNDLVFQKISLVSAEKI